MPFKLSQVPECNSLNPFTPYTSFVFDPFPEYIFSIPADFFFDISLHLLLQSGWSPFPTLPNLFSLSLIIFRSPTLLVSVYAFGSSWWKLWILVIFTESVKKITFDPSDQRPYVLSLLSVVDVDLDEGDHVLAEQPVYHQYLDVDLWLTELFLVDVDLDEGDHFLSEKFLNHQQY